MKKLIKLFIEKINLYKKSEQIFQNSNFIKIECEAEEDELRKNSLIENAKRLNLSDGIYLLVEYNILALKDRKQKINIYEVFIDISKNEIEDWINRATKLINENKKVYDASLDLMNAYRDADLQWAERSKFEYEIIFKEYIIKNPGFSKSTYNSASCLKTN